MFLTLSSICFPSHSSTVYTILLQYSPAQPPPELLPQHTWDSHIESRLGHLFAGPFTQALPPILAFPVKFNGAWFSGMMFINNVETTYKEAGRVAGTIYFLYSLLNVKNSAWGRKATSYTYFFCTDSKPLKAWKSEVYKTGISSCYFSLWKINELRHIIIQKHMAPEILPINRYVHIYIKKKVVCWVLQEKTSGEFPLLCCET